MNSSPIVIRSASDLKAYLARRPISRPVVTPNAHAIAAFARMEALLRMAVTGR